MSVGEAQTLKGTRRFSDDSWNPITVRDETKLRRRLKTGPSPVDRRILRFIVERIGNKKHGRARLSLEQIVWGVLDRFPRYRRPTVGEVVLALDLWVALRQIERRSIVCKGQMWFSLVD